MPRASNQLQHQSGSSVFHGARGADGSIASARSLKTLADCVDQNTDTLQVDIVSSAAGGDATAANQVTGNASLATIATNTQPKTPLLNRTEAIPVQIMVGSGGSNYDALRANGQDLMVMIDDMNPDVAVNSGLATSSRQDTGNASLATIAGDTTSLDGKITACNTGAVTVSASALPSGASTAAKQPALGTAGTASADVISVQGIASMTALVVDGSASTQPVSGTVAVSSVAGTVSVDGSGVTQPVSGSVSVSNFPATQTVDGTVAVSGTVSVDGSGVTQPVSAAALPLPSGASTSALQTSGNTSLATIAGDTTSIDGKTPALGQAAMTASVPVALASDQSALAVTGTFFQATQPVSASALPLPSGASTSALQTSGNTSLSTIAGDTTSIDGKTPALGQAVMAASVPVAIASDQDSLTVETDHSWTNTDILINNVSIAAEGSEESTEFDLGQGVSHEIGRIEVFVDNSAGVELEVAAAAFHTSAGTQYFPANGAVVTSTESAFTFSQDDVGLTAGHRFFQFVVDNKSATTATNVTLRVAYYK